MMGYSTQSKGYKLWDANVGKFVVLRDVTFNESSISKISIMQIKKPSPQM